MRLLALSLILALTSAPPPAAAQGSGRTVKSNTNAWLMYFGDHALSDRLALHLEAQLRRANGLRDPQQLLLRPGLIYSLARNARITAGYGYVETYPYGELPVPYRFPEHRAWEQLQLTHATGRLGWLHRYRLEQRWVGSVDTVGGRERVREWRASGRMRYLLRGTLPLLGRTLDAGEPYLSAYDELFVSFGRNVQMNVFDQNRAYAAVGFALGSSTRLELGYLDQLVAKPDGVRFERNHTAQLALFSAVPFHR